MVSHHHRGRRSSRRPYSTSAICMFTAATTSLLRYYGGSSLGGGGIGHLEIISCQAFQFSPHQRRRSIIGSSTTATTQLHVSKFSRPKSTERRKRRSGDDGPKAKKSSSSYKTIADMMKALEKDPHKFITSSTQGYGSSSSNNSSSSNGREVSVNLRRMDAPKRPTKRTRARVDRPKQSYVYASQKRAGMVSSPTSTTTTTKKAAAATTTTTSSATTAGRLLQRQQQQKVDECNNNSSNNEYYEDDTYEKVSTTTTTTTSPRVVQLVSDSDRQRQQLKLEYARSLGLDPTTQYADAIIGTSLEDVPYIVSRIRVDLGLPRSSCSSSSSSSSSDDDDNNGENNGETSSSYAYVIYKPAGWSILGEKKKKRSNETLSTISTDTAKDYGNHHRDNHSDVSTEDSSSSGSSTIKNRKIKRVKAYDEESDDYIYVDYDEDAILAILTPKERMELMKDGGLDLRDDMAELARTSLVGMEYDNDDNDNGEGNKKRKRKVGRNNDMSSSAGTTPTLPTAKTRGSNKANLETPTRPSITNWLKELKASEGTSVRGGKHWVALSGATEIDDSGLVLLCPRDRIDAIHVDCCTYITVMGNGRNINSRSRLIKSIKSSAISSVESCDESTARMDIVSRIRTGRVDDPIISCRVTLSDGASTSNHAVLLCQDQFGDGVRGDASGDPLDRRSWRRLIHCESMVVSSLINLDDEPVSAGGEEIPLPDDISSYVNRRDRSSYIRGGFLGRQMGLSNNQLTNAYREINGAADGYPGWYVDRYDKWLFVQEEVEEDNYDNEQSSDIMMKKKGPLPSLHDGYTAGIYYLPIQADRSIMGTERQKPMLLQGMAAPEFIPVMENGVKYLVNLGDSFSTGIFLDQRHQRAWLTEICNKDTRVLNCFAHTGAFSIAAAMSGAKTVSLDLDKKWLDRVRPQMELNDILEWEGRHDVIYGDCFDWLVRMAKRNEQFDVVILDPPSTSVGKKKKRWSVKSDMAELVTLAAPLVKSDGLLFTTTNSASLRTKKFVNMCQKGFMDAGITNVKLERVSPMPIDFSSIGSQPVRSLVWRLS